MRPALVLLALGVVALMVQGVAALFLPARFLPDLGLLIVIGIALHVRSPSVGVVLSALIGYATDLLSGSLLGQHVLLRIFAFAAARLGSAHLNLRGALPQALFAVLVSVAHAGLLGALLAFFVPDAGPSPLASPRDLVPHALLNGLAAPLVSHVVGRLASRAGGDDGIRPMRLEPRTFAS